MDADVLRHAIAIEMREVTALMPPAHSLGFRNDQAAFEDFGHGFLQLTSHAPSRAGLIVGYARAPACWPGEKFIGIEEAPLHALHARARAYRCGLAAESCTRGRVRTRSFLHLRRPVHHDGELQARGLLPRRDEEEAI